MFPALGRAGGRRPCHRAASSACTLPCSGVSRARSYGVTTTWPGILFSAVGVLYAVLLGFVVVVVWQKYDATIQRQDEVDAAGDLYHVVDGFPARSARDQDRLTRYAQTVLRTSSGRRWRAIKRSPIAARAARTGRVHRRYLLAGEPNRSMPSRRRWQRAAALRRPAPAANRGQAGGPGVLWFALVAGALAMVAFCYLLRRGEPAGSAADDRQLVGLIAILFVVIGEFAAFSGSVVISSEGWTPSAAALIRYPIKLTKGAHMLIRSTLSVLVLLAGTIAAAHTPPGSTCRLAQGTGPVAPPAAPPPMSEPRPAARRAPNPAMIAQAKEVFTQLQGGTVDRSLLEPEPERQR